MNDDLGFGFALRRGWRTRWPSASDDQALPFGRGERFDAAALDLGALQHGRDQFALAALDFGVLHEDLVLLLDLVDLDLFGDHLLLHDVGLDLVGLVGLRLLALQRFRDTRPS